MNRCKIISSSWVYRILQRSRNDDGVHGEWRSAAFGLEFDDGTPMKQEDRATK